MKNTKLKKTHETQPNQNTIFVLSQKITNPNYNKKKGIGYPTWFKRIPKTKTTYTEYKNGTFLKHINEPGTYYLYPTNTGHRTNGTLCAGKSVYKIQYKKIQGQLKYRIKNLLTGQINIVEKENESETS